MQEAYGRSPEIFSAPVVEDAGVQIDPSLNGEKITYYFQDKYGNKKIVVEITDNKSSLIRRDLANWLPGKPFADFSDAKKQIRDQVEIIKKRYPEEKF
jgi:hypothetical protein